MQFRMIEGYDHSYFYVASVMGDHVRWHAAELLSGVPARHAGPRRAENSQRRMT